ncbi:amino acid adenylation domain-containing protein [Actinoplanes sp. NPDC026670]|uniref:non-ribosomal peptide synthetase n=1 Tax=Actinoplanes sp. NPDC026670 TaxID=3154700 RepID=UPI00340B0061
MSGSTGQLSPGLVSDLRSLATAAGADDFTALSIGAGVLAARLPRPGTDVRIRLVHGRHETIVTADGALHDSFRTALHRPGPDVGAGGDPPVTIRVSGDDRYLYVESSTDAADVPTARAWAHAFPALLAGLVAAPDAPMLAHSLVDDDERDLILRRLNAYQVPKSPYRTLAEPFEQQAERSPDAVALLDEHGTAVTYRQLNEHANRLAHHLRDRGAAPGVRVAVCLERGIDQVVALYAATKTGATYVPIDADLPAERVAWMLTDAAPGHVLTDRAYRDRVADGAWQVHEVGAGDPPWSGCPATNLVVEVGPEAIVHILYTSGTTGRPKGVATTTASALANIAWMQGQYPFDADCTALFKASPGFDISIWEIFWPLYQGARLVICRPGAERDPRHLARLTETYGASQIFLVPTMLTPFLDEVTPQRAGALRWMLCGGEPMNPRIRETFYTRLPSSTLINAFGPTEAGPVTDNTVARAADSPVVPVGRPADNFRVTVLDTNLTVVPIGAPGEAYISGQVGLAQGYWRAPARTAERFVADPYGPPGSRMYRTGDLCRYRPDGALEHLGRIDRQVKIRGMRIEPGEIEAVFAAHPEVGDCAVVVHGDPVHLLAFVVPAGAARTSEMDLAAISEYAALVLPTHMRPERLVPVGSLPATVNGKIDQGRLIAVWQELTERERRVVPAADASEQALVDIYRRLLNTAPVSVLDTFGELGGHSLLVFRLLDECRAILHAVPDPTTVLTATLREVAASLHPTTTAPEAGFERLDDQRYRQAG